MQKFRVEMPGGEYSLISSPSFDKKPSEDEIFLLPSSSEMYEFEFDFCNTPPEICAIIIGYFLICYRGLPLDAICLYSRGVRYFPEYREGHIFTVIKSPLAVIMGSALLFGCETEYADIGALRIAIVKDCDKVDKRIFPALLLAGEKTDARRLISLSETESGVKCKSEAPLGFQDFVSIGKFLLSKGLLTRKISLDCNGASVFYTYHGGVVIMGVTPRIYK